MACTLQKGLNTTTNESNERRILHQPLFSASSAPPPEGTLSPPPPETPSPPSPDTNIPFFHENPPGPPPDQNQAAPSTSNTTIANPTATQPAKDVAIAISVGIVTLGMLSALAFFLYRHRAKHPVKRQKLVGENNNTHQRNTEDSTAPPSSILYIGTVEPTRTSATLNDGRDIREANKANFTTDMFC